jgi:hypothetical protein
VFYRAGFREGSEDVDRGVVELFKPAHLSIGAGYTAANEVVAVSVHVAHVLVYA